MEELSAGVVARTEHAQATLLWLACAAPALQGVQPGQFVMVRCAEGQDPLLRRAYSLHRIWPSGAAPPGAPSELRDQAGLALWVRPAGRGSAWLARRPVATPLDLLGPLGHGFALDADTRHLLLLALATGPGPLLALADWALAREVSVTLLAQTPYPAELVPPEVELISLPAAGWEARAAPLVAWADQVCLSGPLAGVSELAAWRRRLGTRKRFQIALEGDVACGTGICMGCVAETRHGWRRLCRDGPVFDLRELGG